MANRHFSMTRYWNEKAKDWVPLQSFKGETKADWESWQPEALDKFKELLGEFPQKVDPAAEVEYAVEDGELIRERIIFDTEAFASVPCILLKPKHMAADRSNAAIICCNGHPVDIGKDPVAGIRATPEHDKQIALMNYNYGEQMAKAGFLVIVPELRGFGERNDTHNKRDVCNLNYIKGSIFGVYPQMLNIWDIRCCIDYLETRSEVNPERIGMMGLSYGGTMTAMTAALDPRIKAADVMSYINPFAGFGIARGNFCGSQMVPEIYKYFDTHDIAGMIAPRPLLVEMGIYDDCFFIEDLLKGYEGVKKIYGAAGVPELLEEDTHAGPHAFAGNKAFEFFRKHL